MAFGLLVCDRSKHAFGLGLGIRCLAHTTSRAPTPHSQKKPLQARGPHPSFPMGRLNHHARGVGWVDGGSITELGMLQSQSGRWNLSFWGALLLALTDPSTHPYKATIITGTSRQARPVHPLIYTSEIIHTASQASAGRMGWLHDAALMVRTHAPWSCPPYHCCPCSCCMRRRVDSMDDRLNAPMCPHI